VPELVPHDQIPAAAQLSSINVNHARAIGPAIAGVLIAFIGLGSVFVLDAATRRLGSGGYGLLLCALGVSPLVVLAWLGTLIAGVDVEAPNTMPGYSK
jgi:hypothetical protein